MAVALDAIRFRLTGVGSAGSPQTDPNDSLGEFRSSTTPYLQSTLTSNMTTTYTMVDNTLTTTDHTGKWLLFVTGTQAMEARQIDSHDTGTGSMSFTDPYSGTASSGDTFRICADTDTFNDGPTAQECSTGLVDHRCILITNQSGEELLDIRLYLTPLQPAQETLEIACGNSDRHSLEITAIALDTDEPDLDDTGAAPSFSAAAQRFRSPRDFVSASETPGPGVVNLPNSTFSYPIWIRRTTPILTRAFDSCAWLLTVEAANGSPTAGPHVSGMVIVMSPEGYTPDLSVAMDRTPRTFGGARVIATLTDADEGFAVEGIPITFEKTVGVGSLVGAADPVETDAEGKAEVLYRASDDDADEGTTVTVEAATGRE